MRIEAVRGDITTENAWMRLSTLQTNHCSAAAASMAPFTERQGPELRRSAEPCKAVRPARQS